MTRSVKVTSGWAELSADGQRESMATADISMLSIVHIAAVNAANQQISAKHLRLWDANARAWIQTVDTYKRKEHIKLKRILEIITTPITPGNSLYEIVIGV